MRKKIPLEPLIQELLELPDPQVDRQKKHLLIDIIMITVCAVLSGVESWVHIEFYGQEKKDFLRKNPRAGSCITTLLIIVMYTFAGY